MPSSHSQRFPEESDEYRQARNELLQAEIELRRKVEEVAALRRQLPLGGAVPEDYVFEEVTPEGGVTAVRLSELFAEGKDSLLLYNYMYGPAMAKPCASCTSILDGLDGQAPHVRQRANFVVVGKRPAADLAEVARQQGWRNLRLLSSANNTFNRDYGGETAEGNQMPVLTVFVRRGDRVHHFHSSETLWAPHDPGQDSRHVDMVWPLWNLLDLIPEGRGEKTHPKLAYD